MNLIATLQNTYTKQQATEIVNWIADRQNNFDQLLTIFLAHDDIRIVQRAAWPLSYAATNHPKLIQKHYDKLIQQLNAENRPPAVRRNILRIFDNLKEIPEPLHGILMDSCFIYISDPEEAIASRAFALGILEKLSRLYPEILPELKTTVEIQFSNAPAAFKSRARKILKSK